MGISFKQFSDNWVEERKFVIDQIDILDRTFCGAYKNLEDRIIKYLSCAANGHKELKFLRVESGDHANDRYVFTCSSCGLKISKLKIDLTVHEYSALISLGLLHGIKESD